MSSISVFEVIFEMPNGQKFLNINSNFIFSSSIGNLATWRWLIKKFPRSKTQNSFFADHFRFSGKIWPSLMYTTPFVPHVFSSFLFYQELRIFKNYRAFRFKFPDKKLISLCQFTISPDGSSHKAKQNHLKSVFCFFDENFPFKT